MFYGKFITYSRGKAELLHLSFEAKQLVEDVSFPDTCFPEPPLSKFAYGSRKSKTIFNQAWSRNIFKYF